LRFTTNVADYLGNGSTRASSYKGSQIGNHMHQIEPCVSLGQSACIIRHKRREWLLIA